MVPLNEFCPKVTQKSGSDAKIEKGISEIMGLYMGPPRPPSIPLDGRKMAELQPLIVG
tara:strand:- start:32 stop:205 length:174 start_codon:yes stop_codon:yes gene_type:complete